MATFTIPAQSRFVAVFDDNLELMISEESACSPELKIGYEDIDINFDLNILCLTQEEWSQLGDLPRNHQLMDVLEHPVLQLLYTADLHGDNATNWLLNIYPSEFPYFELSSETPEEIVEQLRMLGERLEQMTLEQLLLDSEDE